MILASSDAGAWVAGAFALAAGIVAGVVQLRSVQNQQKTANRSNVITGYDKLVEDLHLEVATAREETRVAREEAQQARKEARDTRIMFEVAEREKHILSIQVLHLEQGLAELRGIVERRKLFVDSTILPPDPQQSLWVEPEAEGDNT